jgi:hypothetical protein
MELLKDGQIAYLGESCEWDCDFVVTGNTVQEQMDNLLSVVRSKFGMDALTKMNDRFLVEWRKVMETHTDDFVVVPQYSREIAAI